jgi:hypothetical protein
MKKLIVAVVAMSAFLALAEAPKAPEKAPAKAEKVAVDAGTPAPKK